ncbi:hypothetical protein IJG92_00430 [Candidatus Saccharibacteria bacterium]|nr:hypothetical protein [Candidatus Saccharibacteria bacterium]
MKILVTKIQKSRTVLTSILIIITSSNLLNTLINRLEKGDLVGLKAVASQGAIEKDILVRNMVSNLEIDAQKRVIFEIKSPFNFIFEPEFSTGSPVGEPRRTVLETPLVVAKTLYYGTPNLHFCIPVATEGEVRHQTVPVNYKL